MAIDDLPQTGDVIEGVLLGSGAVITALLLRAIKDCLDMKARIVYLNRLYKRSPAEHMTSSILLAI